MDPRVLATKILEWVYEDAPFGDLTSELIIPTGLRVEAEIVAKSSGIAACFYDISRALEVLGLGVELSVKDGERFHEGQVVMRLRGDARTVLLLERTVLNLMMLLSGVATKTRKLVDIVSSVNPRVKVAATRKIVPGLRYLIKKAVRIGGGDTHRFSLSDAILIKDNHIAIVGSVEKAIRIARAKASFVHRIEVEVSNPVDVLKAAKAGADVIMLDNMSVEQVAEALEVLKREGLRDKVVIEVSGGIDETNIADYAKLGPDVISTSVITMRPEKVDLSLEVVKVVGR